MNTIPNSVTRLYGAQYRDMHTAIHHVTVCSDRASAKRLVKHLDQHEAFPKSLSSDAEDAAFPCNVIADIEINFRRPPAEYRERKLVIVNADTVVPDVY